MCFVTFTMRARGFHLCDERDFEFSLMCAFAKLSKESSYFSLFLWFVLLPC